MVVEPVVEVPMVVLQAMPDQATTVVLVVSLDLTQRQVAQRTMGRVSHQVAQVCHNIQQELP